MKRFVAAILVLALLAGLLSMEALAEGTVYEMEKWGISVEIPGGHTSVKVTDDSISISYENGERVDIVVNYMFFQSINTSELIEIFEGAGLTVLDYEDYQTEFEKYIKFHVLAEENKMEAYYFHTLHAGTWILVQQFWDEGVSGELQRVEAIVNSIKATEEPKADDAVYMLHTYTQPDGLSYQISDRWMRMDASADDFSGTIWTSKNRQDAIFSTEYYDLLTEKFKTSQSCEEY